MSTLISLTNNNPNTDTLYFTNEEKRNMWIYYYKKKNSLFLFDPITPTTESITFIDSFNTPNIYIVMTACQKEKKHNAKLWQQIFQHIRVISPDETFLAHGKIITSDQTYTFDNTIKFLSFSLVGFHTLCIQVKPYLFLSEMMKGFQHDYDVPQSFIEFNKNLDSNTIILSSFGPIFTLKHHDLFIKRRLIDN